MNIENMTDLEETLPFFMADFSKRFGHLLKDIMDFEITYSRVCEGFEYRISVYGDGSGQKHSFVSLIKIYRNIKLQLTSKVVCHSEIDADSETIWEAYELLKGKV